MIPMNPSWPDLILVMLVVLYTLYSGVTARRTQRKMAAGDLSRGRFYAENILTQWFAVLLLAVIWWLASRPTRDLGMTMDFSAALSSPWAVAAWAIIPLYSVYLLFQIWAVGRSDAARETMREHTGDLDYMLPRTPGQLRGFSALSLTAGFCEEMIYRGFLLWWFQTALGFELITAAIASTLLFGLAHAYQGWQGILRTSLMGGVLMAVRLAADSLWPAVILHAAADLLAGWLVYRIRPDADEAEPTPPSAPSPDLGDGQAAQA